MTGWGLIGASNIARQYMIKAIRAQPGTDVIGVVSSSPERAAAFADEMAISQHYNAVDDLLADPRIECVYISTTNERHHEHAIAAAKAGKHVLCEKPLALSMPHAWEMVAACARAGVAMATNHHLRNAGLHRRMRDLVRVGPWAKCWPCAYFTRSICRPRCKVGGLIIRLRAEESCST